MRIVFMGTPDFAVPCLEKLLNMGEEVVGVFTQTDKPVGRKQILTPSEVKVFATEHSLPVFQPKTLRDGKALEILEELKPELIVVTAYGKILPKEIIDFPKYGCINIHASLLPAYRGAAPIQWSVINGDKKTGVTSMQMDVGLDTGDIIIQSETEIGENETAGELFDRLKFIGADVLEKTIGLIKNGELKRIKQDDEKATYVTQLDKSFSPVDFNKTALEIHNKVRGLNPWPVASFIMENQRFRLWETRVLGSTDKQAGCVIENENRLVVACGNNTSIELVTIQPEGKKKMAASDYLRGHKVLKGTILG
ncbi:MAG: methionyl-tRNA formyltransferase [Ruminococcaceae bacterium]|jgi:methionyl-tRNA formyltransferase|nr:methionyl-tRNA formyltransferase [Oscillospiraceae bacterium]